MLKTRSRLVEIGKRALSQAVGIPGALDEAEEVFRGWGLLQPGTRKRGRERRKPLASIDSVVSFQGLDQTERMMSLRAVHTARSLRCSIVSYQTFGLTGRLLHGPRPII